MNALVSGSAAEGEVGVEDLRRLTFGAVLEGLEPQPEVGTGRGAREPVGLVHRHERRDVERLRHLGVEAAALVEVTDGERGRERSSGRRRAGRRRRSSGARATACW